MNESQISVVEFKDPKTWVLGEREVKVSKIETSTHYWKGEISPEKKLESLHPFTAVHNVIKNTALLNNGSFFEVSATKVMARIQDFTGSTLIRTQWVIPSEIFNSVVYDLTFSENISMNKFHIIGKELQ